MKKKENIINITIIITFITSILCLLGNSLYKNKEEIYIKEISFNEPKLTTINNLIVWDDLTKEELIDKLNKNLYHELSGTGKYFADFAEETGLDPYLAVSIINLETGCKWNCSYLAKNCFNIGGMKGKPSCNGSSYAKFDSLEDGINSYLNMLYKYYWLKGLDTPEKMNSKYAESNSWAMKVNNYYETIKAS